MFADVYVSLFFLPLVADFFARSFFFFSFFSVRQRDLLIALLSRSRYPSGPSHSIAAPMFQFPPAFLRFVPPSAVLRSHPRRLICPSSPHLALLLTWRVISRKPWYFVGHGVQSHRGPDEAWPHPTTTFLPTLSYILLFSYPEPPYAFAEDVYVGNRTAREYMRDRKKGSYELKSSLRSRIFHVNIMRSVFYAYSNSINDINSFAYRIIINVANKQIIIVIGRLTKLWLSGLQNERMQMIDKYTFRCTRHFRTFHHFSRQ